MCNETCLCGKGRKGKKKIHESEGLYLRKVLVKNVLLKKCFIIKRVIYFKIRLILFFLKVFTNL